MLSVVVDLAAQGVLVDVADLEVLKEPAPPALPHRHTAPSLRARASNIASGVRHLANVLRRPALRLLAGVGAGFLATGGLGRGEVPW